MVDYSKLRKKFPAKNPQRKRKDAAIKAIAREYERKRAELGGLKAPVFKKGIVFYVVVIMGLVMLGSLVLSATGRGGKAPISKAQINVRKSINALAIALGRYRYHVGVYPTTAEGLGQLASKTIVRKGWNGPYIRQVVQDPWGNDYVYSCDDPEKNPILYSRGPDGLAGTTDDVLPDSALFDEPFRDTSWTKGWMPHHLRGYVLAPDNHTKEILEAEVKNVLSNSPTQKIELTNIPSADLERLMEIKLKHYASPERISSWNSKNASVVILSHWNHDESDEEKVNVICTTDGDEAELYLNGESCGRKKRSPDSKKIEWQIGYEPGEIKVIAFKASVAVGEDVRRNAEKPVALKMSSENLVNAVGELAFVKVEATDEYDTVHPLANVDVAYTIEGPGEILASRQIKDGCGILIVRRKDGSALPIKIKASAKNFRNANLTLLRK